MKEWYTPAELAKLGLPGLPKGRTAIADKAREEGWRSHRDLAGRPLARRRKGQKGGGWEYHYTVLPEKAAGELVHRQALDAMPPPAAPAGIRQDSAALWASYDLLPETAKAEARFKSKVLLEIEAKQRTGAGKDETVRDVVERWRADGREKISVSAVYEWFRLVAGLPRQDWEAALAPRWVGRTATAECHPVAWAAFKGDFLRNSKPSAESCRERLTRLAPGEGWGMIPPTRTLVRRLEREVDRRIVVLLREGPEAVRKLWPHLERDRTCFHALEAVCADGHEWDVTCHWPDGHVGRPKTVVFSDLFSNKYLSWRTGKTENADIIRLAYGYIIERFGIPDYAYLDNGRGFAGKWMTGQSEFRFRGKVTAEEQTGIFVTFGTEVHFCIPRRGQSKPIERSFKDMADRVSKRAEFEGAYTGNSPMNKPANYGTKTVPIELFLSILDEEVAAHNARTKRRTRVCRGVASFDQAFEESYSEAQAKGLIRRASEAQRRLWMLPAEKVKTDKDSGFIKLYGNRFWAEFLIQVAGQPLIARFDPQDVMAGCHVYRMNNAYLGFAECLEAVGFNNTEAAREQERKTRRLAKLTNEAAALEVSMKPEDIARAMERLRPVEPEPAVEAGKVIRPAFEVPRAARPDRDEDSEAEIFMLDVMKGVAKLAANN
ncbi:MAG: hypothetical protein GX595_05425 [Lentisphaerae bacterium]|nr:hypothetical protein [Lentisphaerota bacterium]